MSELLTGFLELLHNMTEEELIQELEKAKEDSKDSYLMDDEK